MLNSDDPGAPVKSSTGLEPRRSPLGLGDKVPPFVVPDQNGAEVSAAELTAASGSVLIVLPRDGAPATRPAYEWVRRNQNILSNRHIEVLFLNPQSPNENAMIAKREDLHLAFLSDPTLTAQGALGVAPGSVWSFVLGSNGRVQLSEQGLVDASEAILAAESLPGEKSENIFLPF